jgi:predicted site-specific integrase-resolvase
MKISIGKAAQELGVTRKTLRRWEKAGKIVSERTQKGHRRYNLTKLLGVTSKKNLAEKRTIAYARVSSHDQKKDLIGNHYGLFSPFVWVS